MKIGIVTTGGEIMNGLTQDTNFSWAAERLASLSFEVCYHVSVGDNRDDILFALRSAAKLSEAVIVSGGLGPTTDDITAQSAADYFGVPLELNAEAHDGLKRRFAQRGREFKEIHKKQAYFPTGSQVLPNDWGTAPGFSHKKDFTVYFFLPGVPREFQPMVEEYVVPELRRRRGGRERFVTRLVKVTGLMESEVAQMLGGMEREGVYLGYRAHFPEVHLRVTARGGTGEEANKLASEFTSEIRSRLGRSVFTTEEKSLEEVVGELLLKDGLTISVAESCTGGLVASRITDVPGSSRYFERGVVTYSNEAKTELLAVPRELLNRYGAVSAPVVQRMAQGVRELSGTDIGVGITGIAGPGGGTPGKPVGTVFIGISHGAKGTESTQFSFSGTRAQIKMASSQTVLDLIRIFLLNDV
ncbi:MAG: competence/damage-inducible protein A [Candidatus Dadabacteria bacterium]|nr:competence/damage-inducible protein A [Candidatus Dadabacteria bacterium]